MDEVAAASVVAVAVARGHAFRLRQNSFAAVAMDRELPAVVMPLPVDIAGALVRDWQVFDSVEPLFAMARLPALSLVPDSLSTG